MKRGTERMAEYINKEEALRLLSRNSITKSITFADDVSIYNTILNMPAAEVAEVKYGKWVLKKVFCSAGLWYGSFECSCCGNDKNYILNDIAEDNLIIDLYCSKCGAKMKGGV